MSYTLIEHKRLDSSAANIMFTNIPQTFTDLVIEVSLRGTTNPTGTAINDGRVDFNGENANKSGRLLFGQGSGSGASGAYTNLFIWFPSSAATANTFGSMRIYIPNYRSNAPKSTSHEIFTENNATFSYSMTFAGLWNNTAAITSLGITPNSGDSFAAGSTATLYGINRTQAIGKPKAIGGNITYANGFWVHTFTGSSNFVAQENLQIDALVVAGGAAGGSNYGGGGGGGGFRTVAPATIPKGSYPVIVGAGGAGGVSAGRGPSGTSSAFFGVESAGGGGGGSNISSTTFVNGNAGASGGGGSSWGFTNGSGGAGNTPATTPSQGNNGGSAGTDGSTWRGNGGGGGAGAVGGNATSGGSGEGGGVGTGGSGGIGAIWNGTYYAGGGGGVGDGLWGRGGLGGGGIAGVTGTSGTANTGGGGGAGSGASGSGGSGVVIIRYRAD